MLVYVTLNTFAFVMFGLDKRKAARGRWRTREGTLLMVTFFGPFGAYTGMKLFRHKTRKPVFVLVPFFLISHSVLIAYLLTIV